MIRRIASVLVSLSMSALSSACGGARANAANAPSAGLDSPPLSASFDRNPSSAGSSAGAGASGTTESVITAPKAGAASAGAANADALNGPCAPVGATAGAGARPKADAPLGSAEPIPFALKGTLVYLPEEASALPDFSKLPSKGTLYATKLDVPVRGFESGFPGVSDRFEWFALDYHGVFQATLPGTYHFGLESDDGSKLFIDGKILIDNDGVHDSERKEGDIPLSAGPHAIEVQYFQGPRVYIALVLDWKTPGQSSFVTFEPGKAAPAQIAERPGAVRITLSSDVLFDTAKYDLKPQALAALRVAKETVIDPRPSGRVTVEGHTDDVGGETYNQTLSENRARSVADWFTKNGVGRARIRTRGYGKRAPRVPNDSAENRQKNRRVEIVIEGCPGK